MPFCITPPVATECCMELLDSKLCFECGETMPSDAQFAREIQWANYFVVLILFIVGIWNTISFIRVYQNNNNYISIMRLGNTLYAFGTGIFGICRIHFQFGKPLLVFAAIHNLCEWIFVAYAFYRNRKQREHVIFGATIYIFMVIGIVLIMIPTFPFYALAEQVTGISLDFMLPIVWFILWRKNSSSSKKNKNNDKKKAVQTGKDKETVKEESKLGYTYFVALMAHSVHILFTILPLVVVNFIRDQNEILSRIIEFMIFLSVPATHILYTKFTDLFEENIDLPSIKTGKDYLPQTSVQLPSKLCIKKKQLIQQVFRMLFWYLLCIGIGIFPTIIIPKILPKCEVNVAVEPVVAEEPDVVSSSCPVQTGEAVITTDYNIAGNDFIIGTSTAHIYDGMSESFEYYLKSKKLVENARNFEGNIFFYLNKDMFKPNTYYIVEAWESKEAVQKWMKDPKDRAVWNNKTYNMLKGGKLEINGYLPLNPPYKLDKNIGKGAIRHIFKPFNGCDDIGEKMLNVSNCEWIMNCDHVEVLNEEKREQILVFKSGWRLHCFAPEPKKIIEGDKITYSMIHQCENGITELFQFSADPSKYPQDECHGLLRFDVDLNIKTVDEVYDMYNFGNIPHVQKTYQLSDPSLANDNNNDCDNDKQNKSALCEM